MHMESKNRPKEGMQNRRPTSDSDLWKFRHQSQPVSNGQARTVCGGAVISAIRSP